MKTIVNIKSFIPIACVLCALLFACENLWMAEILQEKTITFDSNGGSHVESQKLFKGERVKRPADPAKPYSIFSGWYEDNGTFFFEYDFSKTPVEDMTLYAKWFPVDIENPIDIEKPARAIEMLSISYGSFTMGSPTSESNRDSDETQHSVTLSSFKISKYQVTQAQWIAVMGDGEDRTDTAYGKGNNYPIYNVSWYDAIVFCNKLSMKEELNPAYSINGETNPAYWGAIPTNSDDKWNVVVFNAGSAGYCLPTEAQWEYACRAGTTTAYNTGDNISGDTGWYKINSDRKTHEVGLKPANNFELCDMHGNVWEWCWDWYNSSYYSSSPTNDPMGASSGSYRVFRGGSWFDSAAGLRSADRGYDKGPHNRSNALGFRLVRNDIKTFFSSEEFVEYLNSMPANSPENPYYVKLNLDDIIDSTNGTLDSFIESTINDVRKFINLELTGNTLKIINSSAFLEVKYLVGITIPKSVTLIEQNAFYNCVNLISINVNVENPVYISVAGVLYNKDKTILIDYPPGKKDTPFTIPNGVTKIEQNAFAYCANLTGVIIPNSVIVIAQGAFAYCTGLADINIPYDVTINLKAFYGCINLTSVTIEGSDSFDRDAFEGIGDLREKYYENGNGGPGTYTTTAPVSDTSEWTRQN